MGVVNADGTSSSLAYDQVGRLASARDEIGRVLGYGYDVLDRLTTATDAGGGKTVFGYDLAGRVRRQVLPDGTAVATALGAGGAQGNAGEVAWQELSGWETRTDPEENEADPENSGPRLRTEYGYDTMGRVVRAKSGVVAEPGVALTETDAIVAAGTSPGAGARENLAGPATSQFGYDLLGRVVSADNGHAQWDYEYDTAAGGLKRSVQKFVDGGAEYETSQT